MSLARAGARARAKARALHTYISTVIGIQFYIAINIYARCTCISTVIGIQFYIAINTHVAQMYFYCYWDSILYSY